MSKNKKIYDNAEFKHWSKSMLSIQIFLAVTVFIIEVVNDLLLYYNTWLPKSEEHANFMLFRYLILTTVFNFGVIIIGCIVLKNLKEESAAYRYALLTPLLLLCFSITYSHYQYADVLPVFIIPITVSAVYEDKKLTRFCCISSLILVTPGVAARICNTYYPLRDSIVEGAIAYVFILCFSIIVNLIIDILSNRGTSLENAIDEAKNASRAKSDFLSNMSHEIRTPMNAIVGMTELILREDDVSENIKDYCYNIQNSGRSLLSIINDILDFSKIESGKMDLIEESFNIASTLNDVVNMAITRKGSKPIEIIVRADPDIPRGLLGDEVRIRQVMINLMTNAVKFTNSGTVTLRVSQTKQEYGINLTVSVKDTGIGITPENLEKLFTSFQQVDTKKNRSIEGTGLGLAISKRLISQMGGFMNVSSVYGEGSEFKFVIPLKVTDPDPFVIIKNADKLNSIGYFRMEKFGHPNIASEYIDLINELKKQLHTSFGLYFDFESFRNTFEAEKDKITHCFIAKEEYLENKQYFDNLSESKVLIIIQDRINAVAVPPKAKCINKPFYTLSIAAVLNDERIIPNINERRNAGIRFIAPKARILIVDDNIINIKVAVGLMRPYHMQVFTADSADAAIRMLASKDFDLVFMDHMMPVMDGVEATHHIRNLPDEYYKKVPIIALTANAVNGVKDMFISNGFNDFIAKPIELNSLDRVLRTWIPKELKSDPVSNDTGRRRKDDKPIIKHNDSGELISRETGMFYTGGDEETYIDILSSFIQKADEKREMLEKLFEKKEWKNYIIEAHALKSSALTIGAKQLSNLAKELELSGKAGNFSVIEDKHAACMEFYKKVTAAGYEMLGKEAPKAEQDIALTDITREELGAIIAAIKEGSDSFDGDAIAEAAKKAVYCKFNNKELAPYFKKVISLAEDFEYDAAYTTAAEALAELVEV